MGSTLLLLSYSILQLHEPYSYLHLCSNPQFCQPLPWDCAVDLDDDPEDGLSEVIVIKDHGFDILPYYTCTLYPHHPS